jgi:hypothetical protein
VLSFQNYTLLIANNSPNFSPFLSHRWVVFSCMHRVIVFPTSHAHAWPLIQIQMRSFMFIAANHVWLKLTHSLCSFITKPHVHTVARVCRLHRRSCSFTQPPSPRKEKHLAVGNGFPRQCSRKREQHGNIGIWACHQEWRSSIFYLFCSHPELQASSIHLIVFVST